jgi:hypothetical protein
MGKAGKAGTVPIVSVPPETGAEIGAEGGAESGTPVGTGAGIELSLFSVAASPSDTADSGEVPAVPASGA